MATLDIRKQQDEEITKIIFNGSNNELTSLGDYPDMLTYKTGNEEDIYLCSFDELDTFIAAIKKAKELWG
jgi:hypothetical protein